MKAAISAFTLLAFLAWVSVAGAASDDSVAAPGALSNAVRALEAHTHGKVLEIRLCRATICST
jgi:hypothetical protein